MHATAPTPTASQRYAKTIEVSKRIRWDIDQDIIRGRQFDLAQKFLPDSLSLIDELGFLDDALEEPLVVHAIELVERAVDDGGVEEAELQPEVESRSGAALGADLFDFGPVQAIKYGPDSVLKVDLAYRPDTESELWSQFVQSGQFAFLVDDTVG